MAVSEQLLLVIKAEAQQAVKQMKQATGAMNNMRKETKSAADGFKNFAMKAAGVFLAVKGLATVFKGATDAYTKQLNAETKLEAALKATGYQVGYTAEQLKVMAKEMQNATTFGDELIIEGQAIMTTFTKIGKDVFPDAMSAAADMSKMFGQDLQQSVIQLGTALNDPIAGVGRLKRIGISFSEDQKDQIKQFMEMNDIMGAQAVILDELGAEFGGVAEAMAQTPAGQLAQAQNQLGDTMEKIGAVLLPLIADGLSGFSDWVNDNENVIVAAFEGIAGAIGIVADAVGWVVELFGGMAKAVDESIIKTVKLMKAKSNVSDADLMKRFGLDQDQLNQITADMLKDSIIKAAAMTGSLDQASKRLNLSMEKIFAGLDTAGLVEDLAVQLGKGFSTEQIAKSLGLAEEDIQTIADHFGLIKNAVDENTANFKSAEEEKTDIVADELAKQQALLAEHLEMERQINEEYAEAELERRQENIDLGLELASEYAGQITSIIAGAYANQEVSMDNRYKKEKKAINANVKDEKKRTEALAKLDEQYAKEKAELKTKEFKAMKAANIIEATINTAQAVVASLAEGGAAGIAMAVIAGALGIAQVAIIASQQTPSFAEGGSFVANGPQTITVGDNPTENERVTVTPLGGDEDEGGGSGGQMIRVVVNMNDQPIIDTVQNASRRGELFIDVGSVQRL